MYDLMPKGVFAHKRVFDNPRAVARMERMLAAMGLAREDVPVVDIDDVNMICELAGTPESLADDDILTGGHGRVRQGHLKIEHDPVLVFNTFVWDEADRLPLPRDLRNPHARRLQALFCGVGENFAYSRREGRQEPYVCQGGWGVHTLGGCVHKCDYCGQGFIVNVMLDLDEFCEHLAAMFARRPEQLLYRYDLFSDVLAFEPEYGGSEALGKCFAENGRWLLLYTRSDNVRYLADLEEREHVLINWTLATDTQCREIERDSPTLDERIEAMRFCQEQGYAVRAGFSPIFPVADWRAETTDMLERLFARVEPEVLRGWVLSMMEADEFERMFDVGLMDPWAIERMRAEADALAGLRWAPFPMDVREVIYTHYLDEMDRLRPGIPFALCAEHASLWDTLGPRLKMRRDDMFCCCGAVSAPRVRRQKAKG